MKYIVGIIIGGILYGMILNAITETLALPYLGNFPGLSIIFKIGAFIVLAGFPTMGGILGYKALVSHKRYR